MALGCSLLYLESWSGALEWRPNLAQIFCTSPQAPKRTLPPSWSGVSGSTESPPPCPLVGTAVRYQGGTPGSWFVGSAGPIQSAQAFGGTKQETGSRGVVSLPFFRFTTDDCLWILHLHHPHLPYQKWRLDCLTGWLFPLLQVVRPFPYQVGGARRSPIPSSEPLYKVLDVTLHRRRETHHREFLFLPLLGNDKHTHTSEDRYKFHR